MHGEKFQNLHTHTKYVDGYATAKEMALAAIVSGGDSIGFSEHSHVPFDPEYSMSIEDTPKYISDVLYLKKELEDEIEVFLGLEQDYYTDYVPDGLEYIIGTVHHIEYEGKFITVDACAKSLKKAADEHFGGDFYALSEVYFATVGDIMNKMDADIIGHFDLLSKFNFDGKIFDESNPRYVKAAISAMDKLMEKNKLFEVNTGAMYRRGKKSPYPSEAFLKELCKRGAEIILSSDSHKPDSLFYMFNEVLGMVRNIGFGHIKRLTKEGFIDVKI